MTTPTIDPTTAPERVVTNWWGRWLLLPLALLGALRIVQEYERGVLFRLGHAMGVCPPGPFLIIPGVERLVKTDLRIVTMDVPSQEAITKDNVTVKVNAVVYFRIVRPWDAVLKVMDHIRATFQIAQTTLRSVLGQSSLDELLSEREKINQRLQQIIDEQTEPWGVKVSTVEVKDVELPQGMQRAMARQAEAERERRAKIINAEGEFQAAERLAQAGEIIARTPTTLQLRFLQTLAEIATEKNSTIVFPVPIDMFSAFMSKGVPMTLEASPMTRGEKPFPPMGTEMEARVGEEPETEEGEAS
ncbi:MAG: slipin family protein [Dehalococcoidia bacterium]|nr:slipin family protein [Dehalococcoidia bacterium]